MLEEASGGFVAGAFAACVEVTLREKDYQLMIEQLIENLTLKFLINPFTSLNLCCLDVSHEQLTNPMEAAETKLQLNGVLT